MQSETTLLSPKDALRRQLEINERQLFQLKSLYLNQRANFAIATIVIILLFAIIAGLISDLLIMSERPSASGAILFASCLLPFFVFGVSKILHFVSLTLAQIREISFERSEQENAIEAGHKALERMEKT